MCDNEKNYLVIKLIDEHLSNKDFNIEKFDLFFINNELLSQIYYCIIYLISKIFKILFKFTQKFFQ